jgi:hypothetical protein
MAYNSMMTLSLVIAIIGIVIIIRNIIIRNIITIGIGIIVTAHHLLFKIQDSLRDTSLVIPLQRARRRMLAVLVTISVTF